MSNHGDSQHCKKHSQEYEPFARSFAKFTLRDFQHNTRLNIKNVDHSQQVEKRRRMIEYWQDNVVACHLPPIDSRKRSEMNYLKKVTSVN